MTRIPMAMGGEREKEREKIPPDNQIYRKVYRSLHSSSAGPHPLWSPLSLSKLHSLFIYSFKKSTTITTCPLSLSLSLQLSELLSEEVELSNGGGGEGGRREGGRQQQQMRAQGVGS